MSDALVQTHLLTKRFGNFTALDDCSLTIERGSVFGLLGPNGAGKSTMIRLIMGYLNPTSGSATVAGLDSQRQRIAVHQHVSYLPGDARLFKTMRGHGVLRLFSQFRTDMSLAAATAVADRLELDLSRWVAFMSTGMRQKLALAIALANDAPLLILDEPFNGLDPVGRFESRLRLPANYLRCRTACRIRSTSVAMEIRFKSKRPAIYHPS